MVIYNKGKYLDNKGLGKIINLPNVGRESHTWLYHIVSNYENLDEVNIFLQGRIDDLGVLAYQDVNEYLNECMIKGFSVRRFGILGPFHWSKYLGLQNNSKYRKNIITLIKPEKKLDEILPLLKKEISLERQIFWVCPLIDISKNLNYTSAKKKFEQVNKLFPNQVGLIHGAIDKKIKDKVLQDFLTKKIKILVSTTVIEVGIDFPSANTIIIEDSNKFGLSQLHQLRGRVGRGNTESICILLYKNNLSKNARERLKILRSTNDGFIIAEKDMQLRGFGDILGFQQSGIKNFKFADPFHHKDLFLLAEKEVKKLEKFNFKKFENLLKLHDKADIISEIGS